MPVYKIDAQDKRSVSCTHDWDDLSEEEQNRLHQEIMLSIRERDEGSSLENRLELVSLVATVAMKLYVAIIREDFGFDKKIEKKMPKLLPAVKVQSPLPPDWV